MKPHLVPALELAGDGAAEGEALPSKRELSKNARRILQGPLALEVARFGTPLAVGMGLQTTFNLVDAYIIARLGGETGSAALGAIGVCDLIAAVGSILSYGISIATGAIISRKHGEGDELGVRRVVWQSMLMLVTVSLAFGLLGILGANFLMVDVARAQGRVAELGIPYLRVMLGGSFSIFLLLHLITIQRALGSSKTPISMLIAANVANLALAVVFVYGPGDAPAIFSWGRPIAEALGVPRMGLVGAAWATVLARSLALLPTLLILVKRHSVLTPHCRTRPDGAIIRQIWHIAWPTSSQLVVRILAIFGVFALANEFYTTAADQSVATALGVVLRLETMVLFVGLGWGSGAQTFMGQNLGAGNWRRAKVSGWYVMLYNCIIMLFFWLLCQNYGAEIVGIFNESPQVLTPALDYLTWVAPSYIGLGIGIVLGSAIQGAGATRQTLLLDLLVIIGLQAPISVLVVWGLGMPSTALWQAIGVTYLAFAVLYIFSYRRGTFLGTRLPDFRRPNQVPQLQSSSGSP